jgi:hypothetical protein
MKTAFLLLACAALAAADPVVTYTKSFPGSVPAFVSVEIRKDGSVTYKEAVDDEEPVDFRITPEEVQMVFGLADTMDHFSKQLESGLKVANMGKKTFTWQDGATKHEASFNFSMDENAKTLLDWFERVTETQQLYFTLERSVKFDRLGVNKSILQVEAAWDRKRLVGQERFLPLLDRVAKNDSYLHMARERAAALADAFRNPRPKASGE